MKSLLGKLFMNKEDEVVEQVQEEVVETVEVEERVVEAPVKTKEAKHDVSQCGCYKCEIARDQGAK